MRTKTSRFNWVFGVLGAWASYASVVIAPGCGATDTQNGGTDSNTHWLEPCERDSECDENLSCVCGVCTAPCEDDDACSELEGASCALANTCAGPREETSCVVGCQNDGDCGGLGDDFVCEQSQCIHQSIAAGGSGGQSGEPGGDAGAPAGAIGGKGGNAGSGGTAGAPIAGFGNQGSGAIAGFAGGGNGGRASATGGSAGSGAIAGAGSPSTGGSGPTGPCAPMDVQQSLVDLPCLPGAPTFYWNGYFCTPFSGCQCVGEDCDEVYPSMAACDESYRSCYEERGITGECETDDDCKMTYRGCCEACGVTPMDLMAATSETEEALWHECSEPEKKNGCPDCAGQFSQEGVATCIEGRCQAQSLCEPLNEANCEAEELCDPVYARLPGVTEEFYAGCRYAGVGAPVCTDQPPSCGFENNPLADVSCVVFGSSCQPRNYIAVDCSDTACQP